MFFLARFANVMELEICVRFDPYRAGRIRLESRRRQNVARQVDFEISGLTAAQIARRIERAGFRVYPSLLVERQPRDVTRCAPGLLEGALTGQDGAFDFGLKRDDAARRLERGLPYRHGSDIGAFELNPPLLNIARSANSVVLSWSINDTGYTLQSAPAFTGPFTNLPAATNPATNPITGPQQFYRLIQ